MGSKTIGSALYARVLTLVIAGVLFGAQTVGAEEAWRPSAAQLARLYRLEPYIRYFSSLRYGPGTEPVSADYIRALVLAESGGDPQARSSRGARGVAQIMPSTARMALRALARLERDFLYIDERVFEDFEADDLYDPALNLLIACYLSANYHTMYDGRPELMAAAWNAGPGAVARYGNRPPPYPETQGLIRRLRFTMDVLSEEFAAN